MYFIKFLIISLFLPISVCSSATLSNEHDGRGWFERSHMGAAYERVAELKKEKILDVDPRVRLRSNFYRVRNQIVDLKRAIYLEYNTDHELQMFGNPEYSYALEKFKKDVGYNAGNVVIARGDFSGALTRLQEGCKLFDLKSLKQIEDGVKKPMQSYQQLIDTKVGYFEWYSMGATYRALGSLKSQGLDVDESIRIRDNFNRLERQVLTLNRTLTVLKDKNRPILSARRDLLKCLENTGNNMKGIRGCIDTFDTAFKVLQGTKEEL